MSSKFLALETYLLPFRDIFMEEGVNEVIINQPQEVWIETRGAFRREIVNELDFEHLLGLGKLVAQSTDQMISEEKPLLSASLPNGYRIQIIFPPACEVGAVAMSIRKPSELSLNLDDYEKLGIFEKLAKGGDNKLAQDNAQLNELLASGQIKEFLKYAIINKKNLIVSGGTSSGKTTFINAVLSAIHADERLITVEDAREVKLPNHLNKLHLVSSRGSQGLAKIGVQDLIEACLRLRPDRIIVGELRGLEAFSFLRAINTGHPGSISTLHADSPKMAIEQLKLMVMQASLGMPPEEIKKYILEVIDVIIQLKKAESGKRYVSAIYFKDQTMP
jgi:type IV secretion system protein VirB11